MERLSKWIHREVDRGRLRPLKASRSGLRVSHLFFADDILLLRRQLIVRWSEFLKESMASAKFLGRGLILVSHLLCSHLISRRKT